MKTLFVLLMTAATASGAAFTVSNTNDSGIGSLRRAISDANSAAGPDFVTFTFASGTHTITLTSGEIEITDAITIDPPSNLGIIVDGDDNSRVFNITGSGAGGVVEMKGLRLINGDAPADGGALRIVGSSTEVLIRSCGISNSHADGLAGGIYVEAATLTMINSTVSGNDADGNGGGLQVNGGATLELLQSTISNNSSDGNGGGLFVVGAATTATLINNTIAENTADADSSGGGDGGGLRRAGGTVSLGNCIVAKNSDDVAGAVNDDISGDFTTLGHNLIGKDDGGSGFTDGVSGDIVGTSASPELPGIGSLDLNGGDTRTHRVLSGSQARDAGDDALLSNATWPNGAPTKDQRAQFRIVNTAVDIGAVEWPDGQLLRVEIVDASMNEWGSDLAQILITRGDTADDLDVEFEIAAGSAAVGADLVGGQSTFSATIPDGVGSLIYSFNAASDKVDEPDELLRIGLVATADYSVDPNFSTADITIVDTDFFVVNGASSGIGSLRTQVDGAVAAGGGTVIIPAGVGPVQLTSSVTISGEMTIDGNGETVESTVADRVFKIDDSGSGCVRLRELVITGGDVGSFGGGVAATAGTCVELIDCEISNNSSLFSGGGFYSTGADVLVRGCSFNGNSSEGQGGGLFFFSGELTITNSTFSNNSCKLFGGGIYFSEADSTLVNNTITGNVSDSDNDGSGGGGGLWVNNPDGGDMTNTIVAGNFDTPANAGPGDIEPDIGGTVHSGGNNLIGDNRGEEISYPAGTPNTNGDRVGSGASPIDPLLTPSGTVPLYFTLDLASEAYGHGSNAAVTSELFGDDPEDQRGQPRIDGILVDIGAVEMDYLVVIDSDDSGFGTLRNRLDAANGRGYGTIVFSDSVFTADTTIVLTQGALEMTGSDVITVCGREDIRITIDADNASRVLDMLPAGGFGGCYKLKYLTLINGDASGETVPHGGGIYIDLSPKVSIECCIIEDCSSPNGGGGISLGALGNGGANPLSMTDCIVRMNAAANGAGIDNLFSTVNLERCTFGNNIASETGGGGTQGTGAGIRNYLTLNATNCTFWGNEADNTGGGFFNAGNNATATLLNCTFTQNISDADAGGASPSTGGGGVANESGSIVNIQNCVVAGNSDGVNPLIGQVVGTFNSLGNNFVSRVILSQGFSSGNSDQFSLNTPLDPMLSGVMLIGKTGTFSPLVGSPLVGTGNNGAVGLPATDQIGNPRVSKTIDIGSVEFVRQAVGSNVVDSGAAERLSGQVLDPGTIQLTLPHSVTLERVASESLAQLGDFNITAAGTVSTSGDLINLSDLAGSSITFTPIDDSFIEGSEALVVRVVDTEFVESLDPLIPNTPIVVTDNDQQVTNSNNSGPGSLRAAVAALGSGGGSVRFHQNGPETVGLTSAIVVADGRIDICGHNDGTTISGDGSERLFTVNSAGDLRLKNLSLTGGNSSGWGGAIYVLSSLQVDGCSLYANESDQRGGAIYGEGPSMVTIDNTTISTNSSETGGGIYLAGTSTLQNVTIVDNSASVEGGGMFTNGATTLQNVIVANNSSPLNPDLSGTITSGNGNLVEDATGSIGLIGSHDQTGLDPVLGPLSFVGGPTPVHPLWIGSPAIDMGVNTATLATDQRGLDRAFNSTVDAGAYEQQYVEYTYWASYMIVGLNVQDQMDQDPDGDGFPNVIEFACDTDPLLNTSFPDIKLGKTSGGVNLEIPRNEIVDPAHVFASASENLIGWDDAGVSQIEFTANGNNTKRVRFSAANGAGRKFMRLDFIGPPSDE